MRHVYINTKKCKLPKGIKVPTTIPFPNRKSKKNTPGVNFYRPTYFAKIPDQSPKEKALLAVPESKVQEKIVTDYSKQAKAVDKSKLDGLKLDQDIVFDTLKKLKSKGGKSKKTPSKKSKKVKGSKSLKNNTKINFAVSQ